MQKTSENGYILLNAGTATRNDFVSGLQGAPWKTYRTKELMLHIGKDGVQTFYYENASVDLHAPYVFIRLRATDTHFCGMIAEYLAHHRIPSNDPIHLSYPNSAEKISQMLLLALGGIRIPPTYIFREESFATNRTHLKEQLSFPLIYKLDGSKGTKVKLLNSFEELENALREKPRHHLALVQPFIQNTFDTRTLVFKGEILGSISRARTHGYLNNIAQGAIPSKYSLTDTEAKVAIEAAKACRIDFAGVDMIHTEDGPVVLEVNKSPQVGGFQSVYDFKVFTKIAERISEQYT